MPYEKGHPYHPPKQSIPGIGKVRSKHTRVLALAVQERVPASVFVDYHLAIASGKPGVSLDVDEETGEVSVVFDKNGAYPTQSEKTASVNWLSDRGHGLPAQSIQLEANIRQHVTSLSATVPTAQLPPATIARLRELLRPPAPAALAAPIDAESRDANEGQARDADADADANAAPLPVAAVVSE